MDNAAEAVEALVRQYNTAEWSEARMFRKLMRVVSPHVSDHEFRVLMFIFDRTYTYGKVSEAIPMRHFVQGVMTGDGIIIHPPVGMQRSRVYECLQNLVDNVIILRTARGNSAPLLAINPIWEPTVSGKLDSSVREAGQASPISRTHNYKNITRKVAPAHTREANAIGKEMQAKDALMAAVAGATDKTHAARDKRKRKLSVTGLEKIWEDAFNAAYPDDTFFRWRVFEQSAFSKAVQRGVPRAMIDPFIQFAVSNFDNVINQHFAWMKTKPTVGVGFVTKHIAEFYQAFSDDRDPNRKIKRRVREAAPAQPKVIDNADQTAEVAALKAQVATLEARVGSQALEKRASTKRLIRRRPTSSREFGKWESD